MRSAVIAAPPVLLLVAALWSGAYGAGASARLAAAALIILAIAFVLTWRERPPLAVAAAAVALLGFCVWILAMGQRADLPGRALVEYDRALLYLAAMLATGLLVRTVAGLRVLIRYLALVAVAVCVLALLSRTLPDVVRPDIAQVRLAHPLGYWNALGLVAVLAVLCCGHLTVDRREPGAVRALAAAALPASSAALILTESRGALAVAGLGAAVYVALARPRLLATAGPLALVAAGIGAAVVRGEPLPLSPASDAGSLDNGRSVAVLLLGIVVMTGVLRAALLPLERRLEAAVMPHIRARHLVAAAGVAVIALAGVAAALDVPDRLERRYDTFVGQDFVEDSGRLTNTGNNGRIALWSGALVAYRSDPLHGAGPGSFEDTWRREGGTGFVAVDGHSLYTETLSELGWPGLVLVGAALFLLVSTAASRARGPDRAPFALVTAGLTAWAVAAAVDWHWEVPGVTLWVLIAGGAAAGANRQGARSSLRPWLSVGARVVAVALCLVLVLVPLRMARSQSALDQAVGALERGDCVKATKASQDSIDAVDARQEPWEILAYCAARRGSGDVALRAFDEARRRAPKSHRLLYNRTLILASTGRDPRRAARAAIAADPSRTVTRITAQIFEVAPRRRWRAIGAALPLALEPDDPDRAVARAILIEVTRDQALRARLRKQRAQQRERERRLREIELERRRQAED